MKVLFGFDVRASSCRSPPRLGLFVVTVSYSQILGKAQDSMEARLPYEAIGAQNDSLSRSVVVRLFPLGMLGSPQECDLYLHDGFQVS